jgi:peptidoglycan/xylan/chitin deacetylase (PgdA/CDA1 family)
MRRLDDARLSSAPGFNDAICRRVGTGQGGLRYPGGFALEPGRDVARDADKRRTFDGRDHPFSYRRSVSLSARGLGPC